MIKSISFIAVILVSSGEECIPSYTRGVGTIPPHCPDNAPIVDAELCYAACSDGFYGVGPVCYEFCKENETDDGLFCRIPLITVPKKSYGRGVGTIPNQCGDRENQNGLCYTRCQSGYYGDGPVCWESCASGYADHGATCYKSVIDFYWKKSYGRGAGSIPNQCAGGQENNGGLCYNRCQSGYYGDGPVCREICKGIDRGVGLCEIQSLSSRPKDSYGRGAGVIKNGCNSGEELDTGLCYKFCDNAFDGVGPVCWNSNFPKTLSIVAASVTVAIPLSQTCSFEVVYNAIINAVDFTSIFSTNFKDLDACLLANLIEEIDESWSPEKTAIGIEVGISGNVGGGIWGYLTNTAIDFDTAIDFVNALKEQKKEDFEDEMIADFLEAFLLFWYDNFVKNPGFNIYIGVAFKMNDNMDNMDIYWYYGSCNSIVLDVVNAGIQFTTYVHRSIEDLEGSYTYFSLGGETPFVEAGIGVQYGIDSECAVVAVGSYVSVGVGVIPFVSIEGGKCYTPQVKQIHINNNQPSVTNPPNCNQIKKTYRFRQEKVDYATAKRGCKSHFENGQLATFGSEREFQKIVSVIEKRVGLDNFAWIGLDDIDSEGTFTFVDGDMSYCNQFGGCRNLPYFTPDTIDDYDEDCAMVFGHGQFTDTGCDNPWYGLMPYVCEVNEIVPC